MAGQKVEMKKVESSNIYQIGYDAAQKKLHISFNSNKNQKYVYSDVPASVFKGLEAADSHGHYHAAKIRDNYSFTKEPNR